MFIKKNNIKPIFFLALVVAIPIVFYIIRVIIVETQVNEACDKIQIGMQSQSAQNIIRQANLELSVAPNDYDQDQRITYTTIIGRKHIFFVHRFSCVIKAIDEKVVEKKVVEVG